MEKILTKHNSFTINNLLVVVMMLAFSGCKLSSEIKVTLDSWLQQKSLEIVLSSSLSGHSNTAAWDIQLSSSEELSDLTAADFTLVNGNISSIVQVDAKTWTVTVTPFTDGAVEIFLLKDVVEGRYSLQKNQASNQVSLISDRTPPKVMISYLGANPTNVSPMFISIVFDEELQTPPDLSHLQIVNGVASNLIGSGRNYSLELVPASQTATLSIQYSADQVTDLVGNKNTHSNIVSVNFNSNRPLPTLSSTSPSIVNISAITVDVHFSDVVTGLDLNDLLLVNATASNLTGSGDSYSFTLTALSPGNFSAQVKDSAVVDGALNPSLSSAVLSFLYDTAGPTFTLSSSVSNPTDQANISIEVTANESVTGLTTTDFIIINATANSLTGSGASYTLVVTANGEGPVSVQIPAAVAVDSANNSNSSSNTLNWYYDLLAPTVTITSIQSPTTHISPIAFQFELSESVVGFSSSDIQVTNGTLANFASVDATHWIVEVTPTTQGDVIVAILAGSFQDQSGRANTAGSLAIKFDSIRPTVTLGGLTSYTNSSPKSVSLTFSEAVTGFDLSDVTLTNATATLSGSGTSYTLSVTPSGQGVFSLLIPEHSASDSAGNTTQASNLLSSVFDTVAPTVTITADAGYYNFDSPISLTATFSEDVTGLAAADFTVVGGTLSVAGSGRLYNLNFTPTGAGVKSVTLKANAVLDLAGNLNAVVSSTENFYYDNSPVTISMNQMEQRAAENDSAAKSFSILMSAAKPYAVDVYYRLQGTAVSGLDHDLSTVGSVQIPAGATSASIPFNLIANTSSNLNKYFQMNLYYANTPAASFGTKYQSRMLIQDVDVARSAPVQISMANMNRCLLLSSGGLRCWGRNPTGQVGDGTTANRYEAVDIDVGISYKQVALGSNHTCAITIGGDLKCWGQNNKSQLGDGLTANRLVPFTIGTGYTSVGVGSDFSCGLKGGDIYCWGDNTIGQLGLGVTGGTRTTPTLVLNGTNDVVDLSVGDRHVCAVDTNKDLYCWGYNNSGQVGDATVITKLSPVLIANGYVKVRTHSHAYVGSTTCGLKDTGLIYCWGKNSNGEVGDGTTIDKNVPTPTFGGYIYSDLSIGTLHSCGLLASDGKIRCWGSNTYNWNPLGGIGHGGLASSTSTFSQPQLVADSESYTQIAAGFNASCGVTTTQRIKCWGEMEFGYLGDPSKNIRLIPEISDLGESYSQVGSGTANGCGITTTGILKCWSGDYYNPFQTGDGTTILRTSTVVIDRGRPYTSVSAAPQHRCGIRSTGNLYCWGSGASGKLGTSSSADRALPTKIDGSTIYLQVTTGDSHTCGITNEQVLKCWGSDSYGQIGDGLSSDVLSPKVINSGTSYAKVAAGASSTCALTTTGDLQCWGYNYYGTIGVGTAVNIYRTPMPVMVGTKFIDLSSGSNFVCAITDAKDLYCWGEGSYYRLGLGNTSNMNTPQLLASGTKFDLVRAGSTSACGIRSVDKRVMCWGTNAPYGVLTGALGNNNVSATTPGLISDTDTYIDISASTTSVCGVTSANVLKCWGHNRYGGTANDSIFRMWGAPVDVTGWLIP